MQSDEAAGRTGAEAGDRHRLTGDTRQRIFAIEPALEKTRDGKRWCWYVEPADLMFTTWSPICDRCHRHVHWAGPPTRVLQDKGPTLYVYRVSCSCPAGDATCTWSDEIVTDWPLRIYAKPPDE